MRSLPVLDTTSRTFAMRHLTRTFAARVRHEPLKRGLSLDDRPEFSTLDTVQSGHTVYRLRSERVINL